MATAAIDYAELYPHMGTWMVRYTSEPMRSEVINLFGTAEIPTPYTTALDFDKVYCELKSMPTNENICFVEATR